MENPNIKWMIFRGPIILGNLQIWENDTISQNPSHMDLGQVRQWAPLTEIDIRDTQTTTVTTVIQAIFTTRNKLVSVWCEMFASKMIHFDLLSS